MKKDKKILNAIIKLALFSAVAHLTVIFIYSIKTKNLDEFNYFKIMSFDLVCPNIGSGITSFIVSIIAAISVFAVFYFFFSNKK